MTIKWNTGYFSKADAPTVYKELMNVEDRTPQNIVDYAANNPDSELYKCFTWDDAKAANEYRKYEARQVVCQLVVVDDNEPDARPVRVMQRASESYEPVREIYRDEDEYRRLLDRAFAEMESFKRRYNGLVELEAVIEEIDKALRWA